MRFCPRARLLFAVEKPVDDERIVFQRGPASAARRFAANDRRARIDGDQSGVGKRDATAVGNAARIHRTMAGVESRACRTNMASRPLIRTAAATGPINSDAREKRLFPSKRPGREDDK